MKNILSVVFLTTTSAVASSVTTQEVVTVKNGLLSGGSNEVHAVAAQVAREEGANYFRKGSSEINALYKNGTTSAWMRVLAPADNTPLLKYTRSVNGSLTGDYMYWFQKKSGTVAFKTTSTTLNRNNEEDQIGDLYDKFDQTATSLDAVATHLNAEDARFVTTNYDSVVHTPEAYLEIKVNGNWLTIWNEMTRWNKFVGTNFVWNSWGGFHAWETNVNAQLDEKATKNWGMYDSETGEVSPDGFTQISSSNILIAANMSYKRVVDTAGVWVLQCNSGTASFGGSTNGYFRVKDGDGNTQFEIVKGNQRELGADAAGITVAVSGGKNVMTIPYSVVALSHPTLKMTASLSDPDWKTESGNAVPGLSGVEVDWSGSSGSYTAVVRVPTSYSSMFVKASYLGGSETVINNVAPTKMQYIYIGNTKYAIGYATISGTGVMTLTPQ